MITNSILLKLNCGKQQSHAVGQNARYASILPPSAGVICKKGNLQIRRNFMPRSIFYRNFVALGMLLTCGYANASLISITFEPASSSNDSEILFSWQEQGMLFEALQGFMLHTDPLIPDLGDHFADNGTTFMRDSFDTTIGLSSLNEDLFSLVAIDLAEFSDFRSLFTTIVNFTGIRQDGTTVFQAFTLDGIFDASGPINDFQTVTFENDFTNLESVIIRSGDSSFTDGFSMDNVVIQTVPAPSVHFLFISGLLAFGIARIAANT